MARQTNKARRAGLLPLAIFVFYISKCQRESREIASGIYLMEWARLGGNIADDNVAQFLT